MDIPIGDNIKYYRELRNMSVQDLADKMTIGKAGIYKWEDGTTVPSIESLIDLSRALDCSIHDLLKENGTDIQKSNDYKQNGHTPRETFYLDLIENNTDYALIPRSVFKDYKIVPDKIIDTIIKSKDAEQKAKMEAMDMARESLLKKMDENNEKADLQLKKAMDEIARLEKEKEELLKKLPPNG